MLSFSKQLVSVKNNCLKCKTYKVIRIDCKIKFVNNIIIITFAYKISVFTNQLYNNMNCRAILEIEECEYELLRFKYSFGRDTDRKGRPTCPIYGGSFYFQVESTDENRLLKILLREKMGHYIKGNIRVFQTYDNTTIRNISFEAYMFFVGEYMQAYSFMPMITTFALSPL